MIPDWVALLEGNDKKSKEKLYNLWSSASQVRAIFNMKRSLIPESHSEEEVQLDVKEIIKGMKDKIDLLFKFRSAVLEEQEKVMYYERVELPLQTRKRRTRSVSEAEAVKERLAKWKNVQLAGTHNELSLSSSVVKVLHSSVTASQLVAQLEHYHLRALVLYNVMALMEQTMNSLASKTLRGDVLAWTMTVFRRTTTAPWHYSQLTTSCGVAFQRLLRAVFFAIVKLVLQHIAASKDKEEMRCLMDALKWNYTATDHEDLNKCRLFPLLRGTQGTYIASLWGVQTDDHNQTTSLLLDTFEFILVKITTRVLGKVESGEAQDSFPGLEKTFSLVDESSTSKLFEAIVNIVFGEFKRAAESYQTAQGLQQELAQNYVECNRKKDSDTGEADKDAKRISREFRAKSSAMYSQEFCARLLGLLHRLFVAIQDNSETSAIINMLIHPDNLLQLLHLLRVGSTQHQFIILQTLPFISRIAHDSLDAAVCKVLNLVAAQPRNCLLEFLIRFVVHHRMSMWSVDAKSSESVYSVTKCAVSIARTLLSQHKELHNAFWNLLRTRVFKTKEEPADASRKHFLEVALSIAGGEFLSLFKGGMASTGSKDGYSIACFRADEKIKEYQYEFKPNKQKYVLLHRVGDRASIRENSLTEVNISDVIPTETPIDLSELVRDIKEEEIEETLIRLLKEPISGDTITSTIHIKTLRILKSLLQSRGKIHNPELLKVLLELSLKKPLYSSNQALLVAEMQIEEMRKAASQSEGKALIIPSMSVPKAKFNRKELWLVLNSNSFAIPLLKYKMLNEMDKIVLEYEVYGKEAKEVAGKILFVPEGEEKVIKELASEVKAFIVCAELDAFGDVAVPMAQIRSRDMKNLDSYIEELKKSNSFLQTNRLDQVIASYGKTEPSATLEHFNANRLIAKLFFKNSSSKSSEVISSLAKPLRLFTQERRRCDKMFRENKDLETLRAEMKKSFNLAYGNIYDVVYLVAPENYKALLGDLKLLNARHILLNLLAANKESLKDIDTRSLIRYLLTMMLEADYMAHGLGSKDLSKKLSKVLRAAAEANAEFFDVFMAWFRNGVDKVKDNFRQTPSLFANTAEELLDGVYVHFLYKGFKLLLRVRPKKIVTHPDVGSVMVDLLSLVVLVNDSIDKYKCILLIKELLGAAQSIKEELTVEQFNNLLANKAIKALSVYCETSKFSGSLLWKNMKEITLKANELYRASLSRYGDRALTLCASSDAQLHVATEVMKSFPEMRKLLIYVWLRMHSAKRKVANEFSLATHRPFYDTQYCLLVHCPQAQSVALNCKVESGARMATALDRNVKVLLRTVKSSAHSFTEGFNRFFVHYPVEVFEVYGFGSNAEGDLGLRDTQFAKEPQKLAVFDEKIRAVHAGEGYAIVIDSKGDVKTTGRSNGRIGSSSTEFRQYDRRDISAICGSNKYSSVLFDAASESFFVFGKNPNNMFVPDTDECRDYEVKASAKELKQISVGIDHVLMLYGNKTLYGSPSSKKEYFGFLTEVYENKFCPVKINENIVKIKKVQALAKSSLLLCVTSPLNKTELYAFGDCFDLEGNENRSVDVYRRLMYPEEVEFADIAGYGKTAAAITTAGELYVWGSLEHFKSLELCEENKSDEKVSMPMKVKLPENNRVLSISINEAHMLVLTEDKATGKRSVLGFGDNRNFQLGTAEEADTKSVLTFFDGKHPYLVATGSRCSFVACGKRPAGICHKGSVCCRHKEEVCGPLYLVSAEEMYCEECVSEAPEICLLINNPIKNLKEKQWPDLKKLENKEETKIRCTLCKESITKGIVYHSAIKDDLATLCENCYPKLPPAFIPTIYYRVTSAEILATKTLPTFSLEQLYETRDDTLSITVRPKCKLSLPSSGIDKEFKPSFEDFIEESKTFNKEADMDVLDLLNNYLMVNNKTISDISCKSDLPLAFGRKPNLTKYTKEVLDRRSKVLIKFNKIVKDFLKYIDFETVSSSEYDLYNSYKRIKDYITVKTKDEIVVNVINSAPATKGRAECVLDRHKAHLLKTSGSVDHTGEHTLYGQLWRALKDKPTQFRKHFKADKFPFSVKFKGDGGVDAGGLFRECIDEICQELQSELLPLLVPTPNNKMAHGQYREKWTVSPSAGQSTHLEMLGFLGALIGMSFRLSHLLPLNLASTFWKQLMAEELNRNDLKTIDAYCVQCLEDIANIEKKGIDAATFESVISESFVTRLSDGTEKELKENGKETMVTFDNRHEYVQLVERARLMEGSKQMEAVKEGMLRIVPQSLIKLYSWRELETKICGKPTVDVEALRRMTSYDNCKDSDTAIRYFWQVLAEFTDEERSLYLRFVWGRSRMPSYSESHTHVVYLTSSSDDSLPEAHTW